MADKEKILEKLAKAVASYDEDAAMATVDEAIKSGINPIDAITKGLSTGIKEIGDKFAKGEAYIPELMLAAQVMSKASEKLQEHIPKDKLPKPLATIVIGTVQGDIHDLGVSIVAAVFSAAGFKVYNLGSDQPWKTS